MSRPLSARASRAELERRWGLLRGAMQDHAIDVLLAQANSQFFGGYVRYICDIGATAGIATTVIFPRDGGSTVITHGANADLPISPDDDGGLRGISRLLTTPNFPSIGYSGRDEQANVVKALEPYATATIGLLGWQLISASTLEAIRGAYPKMRIVDASDVVDPIRAIKSTEEQALIRRTAALQDEAMFKTLNEIEPGMRNRDVALRARQIAMSLGSEEGLYTCVSAPLGEPASPFTARDKDRVICKGDMVNFLMETNGPGGYFTHMVRTAVLGPTPQRLNDELEFALRAQKHTLDLLKPGAFSSEVWKSHNEFMRANDRPEEKRLYCHAQGYDMMETPVMRTEETISIQEGMNIGCHPAYAHEDMYVWVCENFLIGADGAEPIHKLSTAIFEL